MILSRHDLVADVLDLLSTERVKAGLLEIVDILPGYFFIVPSSSTGKHHPSYSLGKGGLLRHCKSAMKIGYDLMRNPLILNEKSEEKKDLILTAIFIHDGLKLGPKQSAFTRFDHPLLMQKFLLDNESKIPSLTHDELVFMGDLISTHMGPWTKDPTTQEIVLSEPKTKEQMFVHLCDYISSRKSIGFQFNESWQLVSE